MPCGGLIARVSAVAEYRDIVGSIWRFIHGAVREWTNNDEEWSTLLQFHSLVEMEDCGKIVVIAILQFASLLGCCCHHLAWFAILSYGIHCHGDFFLRVDGAYRSKEYAHAIYCSISERSLVEFGKLLHAKPVGTSIVAIEAKVHLF